MWYLDLSDNIGQSMFDDHMLARFKFKQKSRITSEQCQQFHEKICTAYKDIILKFDEAEITKTKPMKIIKMFLFKRNDHIAVD